MWPTTHVDRSSRISIRSAVSNENADPGADGSVREEDASAVMAERRREEEGSGPRGGGRDEESPLGACWSGIYALSR